MPVFLGDPWEASEQTETVCSWGGFGDGGHCPGPPRNGAACLRHRLTLSCGNAPEGLRWHRRAKACRVRTVGVQQSKRLKCLPTPRFRNSRSGVLEVSWGVLLSGGEDWIPSWGNGGVLGGPQNGTQYDSLCACPGHRGQTSRRLRRPFKL